MLPDRRVARAAAAHQARPDRAVIDNHRCEVGHDGARRAASIEQLFAEVNENFRAYKVGNHRHVPEMEQEISAALGRDIALLFVPHLLPITRGLLSSIFMRPRAGTTESDVHAAFEASFAKSRFVRILKPGELPELRNVRATNYCELAFILDRRSETLLVITAIDNLGKGASGQAVQNMNLMLGYDEAAGLLNAAPSLARDSSRAAAGDCKRSDRIRRRAAAELGHQRVNPPDSGRRTNRLNTESRSVSGKQSRDLDPQGSNFVATGMHSACLKTGRCCKFFL